MKSFKLKNRVLAALLCLAMVGGVVANVFVKGSGESEAAASLPGITELKNSNLEYNILEIVPDVSQAAFAWYIGDSEPINEKKLNSAYGSDMDNMVQKYQEASDMLQSQNYLLRGNSSSDYSESILKNLGTVALEGNTLTGGFESNEWFHRYVLDWNESETKAQIKMTTISPENVTLAHVALADMVVLSGGYYYPDTGVSPESYSMERTLSNEVATSIISNGKSGMPVILDRRAYQGEGLESDRVFEEILGNDPRNVKSGVYGTVFFFSAVASGDESGNSIPLAEGGTLGIYGNFDQGYLVTPQFNMAFSASVSGLDGPFTDVLASIQKENTSRMAYQQTLLPEEITMARVVQYLISDTDTVVNTISGTKEIVNILSIQPGNSTGIARYDASIHDNFGVAAPTETVKVGLPLSSDAAADQISWEQLESWTATSRENINVVEMSVQDFIRQSDVVLANYDMVYIGNDISEGVYGVYDEGAQFNSNGQTLSAGTSSFYGAIGDTLQKSGFSYTAVLNDISVEKYNELIDFVQAGRPIVIAPYLCAGLNWSTSVTSPSAVTLDQNSNMYKFLSQVSGRSSVIRQDMLIAGPDGIVGTFDDDSMVETLASLVQIPTASIEFATLSSSMPEIYHESNATAMTMNGNTSNNLEYIFKITNPSVDLSGVFKVDVTLDLDGNGSYETSGNKFSSFQVDRLETGTDGSLVLDGNMNPKTETRVSDSELVENQYYRVSFDLPASVSGVVAWNLAVTSLQNASITTSTMSVTYLETAQAESMSILQIYATDSVAMTDKSEMMQLLGLEQGSLNNANVSSAIDFTVHTISLQDFDSVASTASNTLEDVNADIYHFSDDVKNAGTGKFAMAMAMQAYDLVVLSSYSENSTFSEDTIAVITAHMESGKAILYSHYDMTDVYSNSLTGDGEYFWNTEQFKNYPYAINMEDNFVVSIENSNNFGENNYRYYTNADVSKGENDCKILVNTFAIVLSLKDGSVAVPDEEDKDDIVIETIINIYENSDAQTTLSSLQYSSNGTTGEESPTDVYFSIAEYVEVGDCYFEITVTGDDVKIPTFYSTSNTEYTVNSAVTANDIYYFQIPKALQGENATIRIQAFYKNSKGEQVMLAITEINVIALDDVVEEEVDLFEATNNTASDGTTYNSYNNLIPMN